MLNFSQTARILSLTAILEIMASLIKIVYITFPNLEAAEKTASILINERLAACVNIYPSIKSYYQWQAQLCSATETIMLAKTEARLVSKLIQRVQELHSYECPAMLSLSVDEAYKPYEDWLRSELQT